MGRGSTVLVYAAAGGVGTAVIQLAGIAGAEVIGLTSSDGKAARLAEMGVEHVFRYDSATLVEDVLEATGGRGVDVILDSVAGPQFGRNFDMLAPLGQLVWFGFSGGMPPDELLHHFGRSFVKGVGLQTFHLTHSVAAPYPERMAESLGTILKYLGEGKLEPVIHDRLPLEDVARAHELLQSRRTVGKVLLKP